MLRTLVYCLSLASLALALSACSAIELRERMADGTATAAGPAAEAQATAAALGATAKVLAADATESAATALALETAAALPESSATPVATTAAFSSAEAIVYGSVPVDSDRLNTIAALAFDAAGDLLVSTRAGEIYRLRDADADGLADESRLIFADEAEALRQVAGIFRRGESIIALNGGRLSRLDDSDGDGIYDRVTLLAEALPAEETALLASNGIVEAPDGRLFTANLKSGEILLIQLRE